MTPITILVQNWAYPKMSEVIGTILENYQEFLAHLISFLANDSNLDTRFFKELIFLKVASFGFFLDMEFPILTSFISFS